MKPLFNSLTIKIGSIVILTQVIVLTALGYIYINRFSDQIDQQTEEQVQIPGALMDAGLLDFDSISDPEVMAELVGENLISGVVVGANGNIFFALDPDYIGRPVSEIGDIDPDLFDAQHPSKHIQHVVENGKNYLISASPIYQAGGQTPRFFVYVKVSTDETEAEKREITQLFLLGSVAAIVLTSVIIFLVFHFALLARIREVVHMLRRVESGDLRARIPKATSADEIGVLQRGFNTTVAQLEELFETLEHRIAARTRYLQIAADVSRQVTTVLDRDSLLAQFVELTRAGFDMYQVAVFLHDPARQVIELAATTGGDDMRAVRLGSLFRLANPSPGLIPEAARSRQAVIVNDIHSDARYLSHPLLPDTQSEAVFPMIIGDHLIGVLDLQSNQLGRFTADDQRVLTSLAEQIGIAVRNAQLYTESQAARQEAEQANKVKSQFLASMSHELRTPLNAILNFSQFVASGMLGTVNDEQVDILNKITASGRHLLSLINDVLDISKIESGALTLFVEAEVNLADELRAVEAAGRALLNGKPVELTIEVQANLPPVVGDRRRIRQIMLNLVSNACKFTEKGQVTIQLRQPSDDEILLTVRDTGPGIAPEDHTAIFETFHQTEAGLRHSEGTGLGLPISLRLAEAHGGRLWLDSTLGQGATFYVALPIRSPHLLKLIRTVEKKGETV